MLYDNDDQIDDETLGSLRDLDGGLFGEGAHRDEPDAPVAAKTSHGREDQDPGLGAVRYIRTELLYPEDPQSDRDSQRALKDGLRAARGHIMAAKDKAYAWWEVFDAVYGGHQTTMNEWTGEILVSHQNIRYNRGLFAHPTTRHKMLSDLEQRLGMRSMMPDDFFKRQFASWFAPVMGLKHPNLINPVAAWLQRLNQGFRSPEGDVGEDKNFLAAFGPYGTAYGKPVRSEYNPREWGHWAGWETLANDVFGLDDALSQEMLTKFLIGAVARAIEPGCQMRQCLVLQGAQEIGKTQFIRTLFGKEFYASRDSEMADKDVYRALRRCWVMELEELEAITSKRSVENLKRFISVQEDELRKLYEEDTTVTERHCVFIGTVNSDRFLRDQTGNSRFWVLPIPGQVNVDYVREHRDHIWLEAFRRFLSGECHWDRELSVQVADRATQFTEENPWQERLDRILSELHPQVIRTGLEDKQAQKAELEQWEETGETTVGPALSLNDLMDALGMPTTATQAQRNQLAHALKGLGFTSKSIRVNGKPVKRWLQPELTSVPLIRSEGSWKRG